MTGFMHEREFSRKTFLKGGGALVVGFSLFGVRTAAAGAANAPNVPPDPAQVDSYLSINVDNTVTIYPPMMEFGQGTWTGFRQIVADELDVPVEAISIGVWDSDSAHPFPDWGQTAGSAGTAKGGPPLRQAAAEARRTLLNLASAQLGVPASGLSVVDGVVQGAGKSVKYSDLLGGKLFNTTIASGVSIAPLKPVNQYKVVGTRVPRFDIPDIVTGTLTYLQNVRVPEMLHGRPVRPHGQASVYGQSAAGGPASFTVVGVDENSIKHISGARVVQKGNFVGVVAPTEYDAIQAASQLKVTWAEADTLPGNANQFDAMRSSPTISPPAVELDYGNVDTGLAAAAKTLAATYEWPFQMHGPIGPCCAIADVTATGATIFTSGQNAWGSRNWVAQALGLPVNSIRIVHYIGSSTYGPDNHNHPPVDAAIMSQIVGKPVRVQWMRWDSHGWESYGVNNIADIRAGLDADGKILAYDYTSWLPANSGNDQSAPPGIVQIGLPIPPEATGGGSTRGAPSRLPGITSKNSPGGRFESFSTGDQYFPNIPNRRITGKTISRILTVSPLRAPSVIQPAWASESMIDELAHAAGMDALAFRRAHCTHDGWLGVLNAVAAAANWQPRVSASALSDDRIVSGRGISIAGENHPNDDVYTGVVAEVEVDRKTGKITAKHLYGAQDSGFAVNPASLENQITGMLVTGTSRTLIEQVTFSKQRVTSLDWVSYPTLRFKDAPKVTPVAVSHLDEIADLSSTQSGFAGPKYRGGGESLLAAVPAAIGNAVFDATGVRMRQVPLTPPKMRAALAAAGRLYKT